MTTTSFTLFTTAVEALRNAMGIGTVHRFLMDNATRASKEKAIEPAINALRKEHNVGKVYALYTCYWGMDNGGYPEWQEDLVAHFRSTEHARNAAYEYNSGNKNWLGVMDDTYETADCLNDRSDSIASIIREYDLF